MNHSSGLFSLNDDVLLATFSFLDSKAALATAFTCKHAYRLAISRVFAQRSWSLVRNPGEEDGSRALALSRYMCAPEPLSQVPRVQYLRQLTLGYAMQAVELLPLHDILSQAFNLRTIDIQNFEYLLHPDGHGAIQAIGAMRHLEEARLVHIGPKTVSSLPVMLSGPKITTLTLGFSVAHYGPGETIDLPVLMSSLASVSSLRTLALAFNSVPTSLRPPNSRNFTLPSIHNLTIDSLLGHVPARIVTLCPNLLTLSLSVTRMRGSVSPAFSMSAEDGWPVRLKELDLPLDFTLADDTVQRMMHVDRLSLGVNGEISGRHEVKRVPFVGNSTIPDRNGFEAFLPLLKVFRPTILSLQTTPALLEPSYMWNELTAAAPQLRSLDIIVTASRSTGTSVRDYIDPVIAALRSTPLVHLSLHLPPVDPGYLVPSMAQAENLCAAEVRRVETIRTLPLRLAEELPSLRVFALSSCKPGTTDFGSGLFRALASPRLITGLEREEKIRRRWGPNSEFLNASIWRAQEYGAEIARDKRWWWVEGEGSARTPVEVWREDGERARDLIRRADFDPEKGLDGFYSDKCRYER